MADKQTIFGPFVVLENVRSHGFQSIAGMAKNAAATRIAIADQTPAQNILGYVLPEFAQRICSALNAAAEQAPPAPDAEEGLAVRIRKLVFDWIQLDQREYPWPVLDGKITELVRSYVEEQVAAVVKLLVQHVPNIYLGHCSCGWSSDAAIVGQDASFQWQAHIRSLHPSAAEAVQRIEKHAIAKYQDAVYAATQELRDENADVHAVLEGLHVPITPLGVAVEELRQRAAAQARLEEHDFTCDECGNPANTDPNKWCQRRMALEAALKGEGNG